MAAHKLTKKQQIKACGRPYAHGGHRHGSSHQFAAIWNAWKVSCAGGAGSIGQALGVARSMKSHETTEIAGIELLHDHHGEESNLLDPDELALMQMFFSILDVWDKEGSRSAN